MAIQRTLIIAAALAASFAGSAYAQQDKPKNVYQIEAEERAKEAQRIDQQYKAAMERERKTGQGAPAATNDPWSNMRGSDTKR